MACAIRRPGELLDCLGLPRESVADVDVSRDTPFPMLVPHSFVRRMQHGNADDPLLRQVLPLQAEAVQNPGFTSDAVNDAESHRASGLLQKYAGRALLIASGACAIHCRYCFRREYPYADEPRQLADWKPALDTLRGDPTLTEVIFSGGDPLMLNDRRLAELCRLVDEIPHVERIRFHTRLPIVLPSRITKELLAMMTSLNSQVIVVVHANHANEIADDCARALRTLTRSGVPVLNQTVLLRQVNDTADALAELSRRLVGVGVMPYYLHQLDRVTGTAHFEVPDELARSLIAELTTRLPGYAVPRLVREVPGEASKLAVE